MPKLVDYAARFEFLRRASFVVVLDQGPHALSRRGIAAALGTSVNSVRRLLSEEADLRELALGEVAQRRRQGRWGQRGLAGPGLAVHLLRTLLPDEERRIPEELVWLRINIDARPPGLPEDDSVAALRAEYALADRGCLLEEPDAAAASAPAQDDPVAARLAEDDALVAVVVAKALAAIGVEDEAEQRRTRALVDGLVLATCLGRMPPEQAVTTVEDHVASLMTGARDAA